MKAFFKDYLANPSNTDLSKLSFKTGNALDRKKITHLLSIQNKDAATGVLKNIISLKDKNTFAVITGQQLGLMGGPLYTIYKMLNTVKLCQYLNESYSGKHFVPVFWMDGEDADFDEVSTLRYFRENELREFQYKDAGKKAIGKRELNLDINRLSMTLGFEQAFESERNWVDAFYLYFKPVFDEYGIIAFHSNRDDVKEESKAFFKTVLNHYDLFRKDIFAQTNDLEKNGFKIQVPLKKDESFLFSQLENERKKLSLAELKETPLALLSPNVLLRPLYQDWLFPSVIYVAGNAEISYQAQISKVYQIFNRKPPMLFPRSHHLILNPKMRRLLKKYQFNSDYNLTCFDEWKESILKSKKHNELEILFSDIKNKISKLYLDLEHLNFADQKTQKQILESAQIKEEKLRKQLEGKISTVLKRYDSDKINHLGYLRSMLFPNEKLQERVFTIAQFNEKPLIFAKQVFENMDIFSSELQINSIK